MISLILPYWDRQEAADRAFALLDRHYRGLDLEVIVVDDGNRVPFRAPDTGLNVRVIRLPLKDEPKSPCTCWNVGVEAARGDIVVLSCVEILHESPVLEQMADAVREIGPKGYVLAAAWCPDEGKWHCHSTVNPPFNAVGTGQAFCGAMFKALYHEAGGWDEEYRDGAGYEDCDFINRMLKAGAVFVKRDDLVVTHPKDGARIAWKPEMFARNRDLYARKWPEIPMGLHTTFVCLKAGPMYGPEYVNILHDMVRRNLPLGYPGRFVCITDDPSGLDPGIETIALPADLERWWGKLWMFKRGLFPDGSRMIFMDLDTVIVGRLDRLVGYRGQFATLRDLGGGAGLGPAVIAWEAGAFVASIWEEWDAQGRPRHPGGDLWWMTNLDQGRFPKRIDILQDLFPGDFRSYKLECQPVFAPGTRVVCFHGEPRPHNCAVQWVQDCWKVGGDTAAELYATANTHRRKMVENTRASLARGLPALAYGKPNAEQAVIVGGGPSLKDTLGEIRWRASQGQVIFATNGAGRYLVDNGIAPDHLVILDSRPENAAFVLPDAHLFAASGCDPAVFDAAKTATIFHVNTTGIEEALPPGDHMLISTGSTVGLIAIGIAHVMGFRVFHLHGFDSSYDDPADHHAYTQALNDGDAVVECVAAGERFRCAPWMLLQVQQFQSLAAQLANEGCVITVAGRGLLPHVAREMGTQQEAA